MAGVPRSEPASPVVAVECCWQDLCRAVKVDQESSDRWWELVREHYTEPWRHYHTLSHLYDMLQHMDSCKKQLKNAQEVELAIFFHESVYLEVTLSFPQSFSCELETSVDSLFL